MLRNTLITFFIFFFVLISSGCDSSGPAIAPLNQQSVVLAFGDSLTHGTGASSGQSYPDVLGELLRRRVINVGIPGEVTAAGLKRLPGVLDRYKPTLVILCEGGNDFLRRRSQDQTINNLKAMIELIRSRGADVILVGVPRLGFGLEVPDFYEQLAEEYAIPFERDIVLDLLGDDDMKSDAIHPNAAGYRKMAETLHELIIEAQEG